MLFAKFRGTSPYVIYAFQGLFFKFIYASLYAFFGQYLNVDGHQYLSVSNLLRNAWSMKMFFSFVSDSIPICGLRRLPYVAVSLCIIFASCLTMFLLPMPDPYFEVNFAPNNCSRDLDQIQNPAAPNSALPYSILFIIVYTCMAWGDCCIDALLTQMSMLEPDHKRGRLFTGIKIDQNLSSACFALVFALFYNRVDYGGTFCSVGLDFNQMALIVAIGAVITLLYSLLFTNERDVDGKEKVISLRDNLRNFWKLLQTTHFLKLISFRVFISLLFGISSPARSKVETRWVKVEPLTKGFQSVGINLLSAFGMLIFRRFFMQVNWRSLIRTLTTIEVFLRVSTEVLAIFNVFRNQYFWYADDLVSGFFHTWLFFTNSLVVIEYAPSNLEGTSFAFLWSVSAISSSVGTAFGNFLMSFFDVVDDQRYFRDSSADRWAVFATFCIEYCCALSTIAFVFLLPTQKPMAKEWREKGEKSAHFRLAMSLLAFVAVGFVFSLVLSGFTLFEPTRCLVIAGGPGCTPHI